MKRSLSRVKVASLMFLVVSLGACGSGDGVDPVQSQNIAPGSSIFSDSGAPDPFDAYPRLIELEESLSSNLRLGYTESSQKQADTLSYVDTTWAEMQNCLAVTANAPLVIIQSSDIEPVSSRDDVIFDFQGRLAASAHDADSSTAIQILAEDLGDTADNRGFNLRSIMGRYLWRTNSLAERDYRYSCAVSGS